MNYKKTVRACFTGGIVQAVIVNFAPLLFLTFHTRYEIPLSQITMLATVNFSIQLLVDFASAFFVDKIGYRVCILLAHGFSFCGLVCLSLLPNLLSNPLIGLMISVCIYAAGGGLLEVLTSPMIEACPTPAEQKAKSMSLLHSFYSWGCVGVILLSTLFFTAFGMDKWPVLTLIWSILPLVNGIVFSMVPLPPVQSDVAGIHGFKTLICNKTFWFFILMMLCAGASEQAISQWASAFMEQALGISKTFGDLAGPMVFALMMGVSRTAFGKWGDRVNLNRAIICCTVICTASFLLISFVPSPLICLIGFSISGLSIGILWPGTLSLASGAIHRGGTALFALLALAGDLGCVGGPTLVGLISGRFQDEYANRHIVRHHISRIVDCILRSVL